MQGIRDYARSIGQDLSMYPDDHAAAQALLNSHTDYSRMQQLARYGAQYLYDRQNKQQTQAPVAAPAQPEGYWNPPASENEVRAILSQWYQSDGYGGMQPRPETPPSLVEKVNDFSRYMNNWRTNPQEVLDRFGKDLLKQAKEQWAQEQQEQQFRTSISHTIDKNAGWLYYTNQNGQPIRDPRFLTPQGQMYYQYIRMLEARGVTDPVMLDELALTRLALDIEMAKRGTPVGQPVGQAGAAAPAQAAPGMNGRQPSANGGSSRVTGPGAFESMLNEDFRKAPVALLR